MNNLKNGILAARKKGQLLLIERLIKMYDRQRVEYVVAVRALDKALVMMNDANRALRVARRSSKKMLRPIEARAIHARIEAQRALDRQARAGKRLDDSRDMIYRAVDVYEKKFGDSLIPRADKEDKEHV